MKFKYINNVGVDKCKIVDLDGARKLREMGYSEPTFYYYMCLDTPYVKKGLKRVKMGSKRLNHNTYDDSIYSAPTFEQVQKFLKQI